MKSGFLKSFLKILAYLCIGVVLYLSAFLLKSDFLNSFINENLITILLALMAINATTISVIVSKLHDITQKQEVNLDLSIQSMKNSIVEQVIILLISTFLLILRTSLIIKDMWQYAVPIISILLISLFTYAIHILYDTVNSVFVILKHENKLT
jgi:uncharacterized membrane protein YhaH (DUF805 family)